MNNDGCNSDGVGAEENLEKHGLAVEKLRLSWTEKTSCPIREFLDFLVGHQGRISGEKHR